MLVSSNYIYRGPLNVYTMAWLPPSLGGLDESRDSDGNLNSSDSKLHEFFSPQVKLMFNQRRNLLGCGSWILEISL